MSEQERERHNEPEQEASDAIDRHSENEDEGEDFEGHRLGDTGAKFEPKPVDKHVDT